MPFIAPFAPAIIGGVSSLVGGALGGRGGAKSKAPNPNSVFGQMAQKDLGAGSDYFSKVLSDPAGATATTTSDLGKQFQQGINFNQRNINRGGGASSRIAEAPFTLASAAKGQQILAQMGAAKNLADIGGTAGRLDLGQQGLDLEKTASNRNFWGGIGESIGGFLTSPGGLGKDSILSKIIKKIGPGTGGGLPGAPGSPPVNYSQGSSGSSSAGA